MVPIAEHAKALELNPLEIDIFAGIRFARLADGGGAGVGVAGLAHFLGDLEFNGQTVAIPAGNVRGVFAAQGLVLDDDVLEYLVQGGADMDVAVGKGRAIVQHKFLGLGARGLDLLVKPGGFPFFQAIRFTRNQVGLHREVRARQIQCIFVFHDKIERQR